jgi:hypothetical protein
MKFEEAATLEFSFLEQAGFRLIASGASRLLYESTAASVRVTWDVRSGELDVVFGRTSKRTVASELFSLTDVLSMEDVEVREGRMPFQVANEAKLRPFLQKLAEDTRIHAQQALSGNRLYFRRLQVFRSKQAESAMEAVEISRVRSEANRAWRVRDLSRVVALYTEIKDDLTDSEKARLKYATKHRRR